MIPVVYEDDDLIAVNKPEGVPSQAAEPADRDDVPFRLELERSFDYLGTHQRLDAATSGVMVYAKRKSANAALAAQFEQRRVDKQYVAIVEGWQGGPRRLEHHLAPGGSGRAKVSSRRDRRARRAITEVQAVKRHGSRAMLTIRIETGRTHQIRAQLAHVGAPIIGDRRYGGADAPRLMLHAHRLKLTHPERQERLELVAPLPSLFEDWLRGEYAPFAAATLHASLQRAKDRRWRLARRADTHVYRLLNAEGDGVPGVAIDVYDRWCVLHLHDAGLPHEAEVLEAMRSLDGVRGVYVKRRPKQANVMVAAGEARAPSVPLWGEPAPDPLAVVESGIPFLVRLGDGLSTGLFLDQRLNRVRVRDAADGRRVLNLFSYTGGFSVAAGVGGASETLSIDASKRALARARDNFAHAGLAADAHRTRHADCFDALRRLADRKERFDLVVVDPPTYSTTKSRRWKSGKEWRALARQVFDVLSLGGVVLACSNDRRMSQGAFRKFLRAGAEAAHVRLAQMKDLSAPPDYLGLAQPKAVWCVEGRP